MAAPSESEQLAMQEAFFSVPPGTILDDIYRFREDYIADGVDAFEAKARKLMEEIAARKNRTKKLKSTSGPTDSAGGEELARGSDAVLTAMLEALELSGDMFDVFAKRNVLRWPSGLRYEIPGATAGGRLYTAAEEASTDERVAALEVAMQLERRKRRILNTLHSHLSKRVPQAEEAAAALEEAARELEGASASMVTDGAAHGTAPPAEPLAGLAAHLAQVARLKGLLDRLSESSPAAAAAIRRASVGTGGGQAGAGGDGMEVEAEGRAGGGH